jgi:NADP-dependent 3-hydroxy acid dehydrogenase YdfG
VTRPTAFVVGASSGIGAALARELGAAGCTVGLTARRRERLDAVAATIEGPAVVSEMDVRDPAAAREAFETLVDRLDGVGLVASVEGHNPDLSWTAERDTVDTSVRGFVALATAALATFETTRGGHLVGVSSVAAHTGHGRAPAYSASKTPIGGGYLRSRSPEDA